MAIPHTIEEIELPNGAGGLFIHIPGAPAVAYAINFRSGSDKATRAYPYQVAHTLEHMVEAGPDDPQYPTKATFLREIQKNGAWRNASTGEFGISYTGDCIPDEIIRILALRLRAIEKPKLVESLRQTESGNVMEEMQQKVADYARLANALTRKALGDGEWQTSREAMADAAAVTLDEVKQYYSKTHTIDNLRFIIAGDIETYRDAIIDLFSDSTLPAGERLTGPARLPSTIDSLSYEERPALENLFTSFAMALPRQLNAKEIATWKVINNMLCNSWDSRILGKARDAGLCYSMSGYVEITKTQSIWSLETPIGPKNAAPFFMLMTNALKDLSTNGATEDEIQRAKNLLIGQTKKNGQTALELLNMYAQDYYGLGTIDPADERLELLSTVDAQDIAQLVAEFLSSGSRVFSGVGSIKEAEFSSLHTTMMADLTS